MPPPLPTTPEVSTIDGSAPLDCFGLIAELPHRFTSVQLPGPPGLSLLLEDNVGARDPLTSHSLAEPHIVWGTPATYLLLPSPTSYRWQLHMTTEPKTSHATRSPREVPAFVHHRFSHDTLLSTDKQLPREHYFQQPEESHS